MKRILVAPLNWGLGHASRCIPIIRALQENNFEPILASDGDALQFLKSEFPDLDTILLPSYNITYPKNGKNLKLKLLIDSPTILKAIKSEKKQLKRILKERTFHGIISDNRFGIHSNKVPSVIITHQLNVLSGSTTWITSKIHQKLIRKFDECWVPDIQNEPSLSGRLSHSEKSIGCIKYLGILSRFNKRECATKYDLLILLSGPEPQRSILETKLIKELQKFKGKTLLVRGKIEHQRQIHEHSNFTSINFLNSIKLENIINQSDLVLSRSGYSTILDLAKLNKKAFFIPTPGQYEQEYLAKRMEDKGWVPYCSQHNFSIDQLDRVKEYTGLIDFEDTKCLVPFFDLFKGK